MAFSLQSSAFESGGRIPDRHTCAGENLSPPLEWSGVPPGTRSFVLLCDDPDAPGGTWQHWALFDLPADAMALPEGHARENPPGGPRQGVNDFRRSGYDGPCPPPGHGVHHYRFRLLALDAERLDLKDDAGCRDVEAAAAEHALGEVTLIGTYSR